MLLNLVLSIIIILFVGYYVYWYVVGRRAAKYVDEAQFGELIAAGQVIDLRENVEYRNAHIMGARNISYQMFAQSLAALRKDRPVLLYDTTTRLSTRAAVKLHKEGYTEVYILKGGFTGWHGKKASKH
ncbi:rhodanese-like domain-containing protein [Periweissella ghanensis]|uniref:Thiosulfate sulfurtransferase GlpE n=1 Tax=Periweissella ghanensis TaxID=467997 RepID=A0ABN8BQN1_9LACO|nr:rhodanese-like domain-containing protein [Periweissella ghanensis]MCM0600079.1 rhodanese-like domain-containing protein [Periweissella ghanensis]CAH0418963.1 Thiosulfate sulfurtransferase GlpE [Periweissella ghanensis]